MTLVITDGLLMRLKTDFDLADLRWGLLTGAGDRLFMSGQTHDLLWPAADPSRADEVVLLTPGSYQYRGLRDDVDLAMDIAGELQVAAMDLLGRPFPETSRRRVLDLYRDGAGELVWIDRDQVFARVGSLSGHDLYRPPPSRSPLSEQLPPRRAGGPI